MGASILVTDGGERAALAVVRSLGRAGYRVHVCSRHRHCLASASRHSVASASVPDPSSSPEEYVTAIETLVHRGKIDVVLPITEASLLALLPARERFAPATIPFPSHQQFSRICNKALVCEEAESLGVAVPPQHVLLTASDIDSLPSDLTCLPMVAKPARSVVESKGRRIKCTVMYAFDRSSLQEVLTRMPPEVYPILVQRRVDGPGLGVFLLLRDGEVLAAFCHRRIREKPPAGGVSVYRQSMPLDDALRERSQALLNRFSWNGVAMVEYKVDSSSGVEYLMEINARFWGSLQLAIDAGVDFPKLLVAATLGLAANPVTTFRIGVRSRWFWGDVDHLIARLRHSTTRLALAPGAPGRWRVLTDFFKSFGPGNREEILQPHDPAPFLRETWDWIRGRS